MILIFTASDRIQERKTNLFPSTTPFRSGLYTEYLKENDVHTSVLSVCSVKTAYVGKDVTICPQPDVVCLVSSPQGPMGPRGPPGPTGSPVSTSCVCQTAHKPAAPVDDILCSVPDSIL